MRAPGAVGGPWALQGDPLDAERLSVLPHQNVYAGYRYVYVAEFASGWVKVGRTVSPRDRMQCHARSKTAVAAPASMLRCWVSQPTRDCSGVEKRLIALGDSLCSERHRNEYFNGCSLDALVAAAAQFVNASQMVSA